VGLAFPVTEVAWIATGAEVGGVSSGESEEMTKVESDLLGLGVVSKIGDPATIGIEPLPNDELHFFSTGVESN
jgi:hypothetical protein